jgi:uncharacterized protein YfkK (UPF0435 family)
LQKIEPYLTFLNVQQLKTQGVDLETKIEELKDINQVLREKDKLKKKLLQIYLINSLCYQKDWML